MLTTKQTVTIPVKTGFYLSDTVVKMTERNTKQPDVGIVSTNQMKLKIINFQATYGDFLL